MPLTPEQAAVEAITDAELLKSFAHLTHKMDADMPFPAKRAIRMKRDLVEAEILRRMGA